MLPFHSCPIHMWSWPQCPHPDLRLHGRAMHVLDLHSSAEDVGEFPKWDTRICDSESIIGPRSPFQAFLKLPLSSSLFLSLAFRHINVCFSSFNFLFFIAHHVLNIFRTSSTSWLCRDCDTKTPPYACTRSSANSCSYPASPASPASCWSVSNCWEDILGQFPGWCGCVDYPLLWQSWRGTAQPPHCHSFRCWRIYDGPCDVSRLGQGKLLIESVTLLCWSMSLNRRFLTTTSAVFTHFVWQYTDSSCVKIASSQIQSARTLYSLHTLVVPMELPHAGSISLVPAFASIAQRQGCCRLLGLQGLRIMTGFVPMTSWSGGIKYRYVPALLISCYSLLNPYHS